VVAGYVLVARRVALQELLIGSTIFFASNCAIFWALAHYYPHWGSGLVSGVLHLGESLWSAGADPDLDSGELCSFTTREAKRVFGWWRGRHCGLDLCRLFLQSDRQDVRHGESSAGMALFLLICSGLIVFICAAGKSPSAERME